MTLETLQIESTRTVELPTVPPVPRTPAEWRELRERLGIGPGELARRSGLAYSTVHRLEHGGPVSERVRRLVWFALGLGPMPERELHWRREPS